MIALFTFFAFVVVLLVIYQWTSMASMEGFDSTTIRHQVKLPSHAIPVIPPPVLENQVAPVSLPGSLPVAPYQQIASMSPLPYQDTTQIKANRQQLTSLLEMLKGFLSFEAQHLSERSDPTIQLPLQTARSDFQELQSQVSVLNRNPGVQPTITLKHMNDISSNLAFLQQQVRLIGAAGSLQGPVYEFTVQEGFANAMVPSKPSSSGVASMADLKNAMSRIQGEIVRLSASGTNDPLISKRVATLTTIKSDIQAIVDQVTANTLPASEIPIKASDVQNMLPMLGDMSQPLPQLIQQNQLPQGLANLLPSSAQKDPDTMRQINRLVDKYADQLLQGVSASVTVSYSPPAVQKGPMEAKGTAQRAMKEAAKNATREKKKISTVDRTGFPSLFDLENVSQPLITPHDSGMPVTDPLAPTPQDAGRGPSQFDWKQRAKEIEDQVKKRNIRPEDVGMMPSNTKVSPEFSWKGYARMMCTRLQATMDPSLPVTCGCPPMDWKGWRIAA